MPYIEHLYYEEAGAGRPLILIHCPALSHIYWRPVMDRLQSSCRCIAIDVRGHGRSGLGDQPWTFQDIADDVTMLTKRLNLEKPVLGGYSSGASIAFLAVLDQPDLYGGVVSVGGFSECCTLTLRLKVAMGMAAVNLGLTGMIGPNIIGTNSVDKYHTQAMLPDAKQTRPNALRSFFKATTETRFTHRLHEIQVPVLLVHGGDDDWMHGYYRTLHDKLPKPTAVFFPNTDHRVPTRRPDDFSGAVAEFLASLERSPEESVPRVDPPYMHPGPTEHQLHQ